MTSRTNPQNGGRLSGWFRLYWKSTLGLLFIFAGIGILVNALMDILALEFGILLFDTESPYLALFWLFVFYAASGFLLISWWIASWRAANKHRRKTGTAVFANVVKALVVLFIVIYGSLYSIEIVSHVSDTLSFLAMSTRSVPSGVRISAEKNEVEVYGQIEPSSVEEIKRAVESANISVVRLSATGGRPGPAKDLEDFIRAHGLDTFVSDECSSACIIAFLGGKNRRITENARLGFHSFRLGGSIAANVNARFRAELESARLSPEFRDKVSSTPPTSLWYPSKEELVKAGVVTAVLPENSAP